MGTIGSTLKIYLADGTAAGLKVVEKSNWTGKALFGTRTDFPKVKSREEFSKPGVYILLGNNDESDLPEIYIGEGDPVLPRIESHYRQKDFWTHFVFFTSKDTNLNKAHIQYLESRLVEISTKAKRYEVLNGNSPLKPALSEAEVSEMECFLGEMLLVYSVLGITAFDIPSVQTNQVIEQDLFFLRADSKQIAKGTETPEGFVVFSGATMKKDFAPSCSEHVKQFRANLIKNGVIKIENENLILTQDYAFPSPSMAASVIHGRSANGRIDWKNGSSTTLKDVQESKAK